MSENKIPYCFEFLKNIRTKINLSDNKIIIPYTSKFISTFETLVILFPFVIIPFLPFLFVDKYTLKYVNENYGAFVILYIIIAAIFLKNFTESTKNIDFNNNTFYSKIYFFGFVYIFDSFNINDIVYVCNNVTTQITSPGNKNGFYEGKRIEKNPKTNQFQHYYVSFLLKDGTLKNFIHLGIFEEDYKNSLKIAEQISDYWNLPLVICRDDCTLAVYRDYNNILLLKEEKIGYMYDLLRLFYVLIFFAVMVFICYCFICFANQTEKYKKKSNKSSYDQFYFNDKNIKDSNTINLGKFQQDKPKKKSLKKFIDDINKKDNRTLKEILSTEEPPTRLQKQNYLPNRRSLND